MDSARTLTMSAKELDRLEVLGRVVERRLTQRQAALQAATVKDVRAIAAARLRQAGLLEHPDIGEWIRRAVGD